MRMVAPLDHEGWEVQQPTSEDPDAARAKLLIEQLDYPELLPRAMVPTIQPPSESSAAARCVFSVMQFNLLAEGLSSPPHAKPPFAVKEQQISAYGGFDSVPNADTVFNWSQRKLRLLQEILRYTPDLLAVEECACAPCTVPPLPSGTRRDRGAPRDQERSAAPAVPVA